MEAACRRWLGISASHAGGIAVVGLTVGAAVEAFMVKAWIGKTNFYETVKRKEAERRADVDSNKDDSFDSFAATLKKQWEERKREMAAANDQSK